MIEVIKDISPEIKAGDVLVKQGKYYVKKGAKKGKVKHIVNGDVFNSPNFYDKDSVHYMSDYFKKI